MKKYDYDELSKMVSENGKDIGVQVMDEDVDLVMEFIVSGNVEKFLESSKHNKDINEVKDDNMPSLYERLHF